MRRGLWTLWTLGALTIALPVAGVLLLFGIGFWFVRRRRVRIA